MEIDKNDSESLYGLIGNICDALGITNMTPEKGEKQCCCSTSTQFRETVDDNLYILQVVATGYTEEMVSVTVNRRKGVIEIKSKVTGEPMWFMPKIDMIMDLPEGINYDTLQKSVSSGVITITGTRDVEDEVIDDYEL